MVCMDPVWPISCTDTDTSPDQHHTNKHINQYLGVSPCEKKFEPTLFTSQRMLQTVEELKHEEGVQHRNRLGASLSHPPPSSFFSFFFFCG